MAPGSRSNPTLTTLAFVERYSEGDFPTDHPPEQPSDLYFQPKNKTPHPVPAELHNVSTLQSVATSVQNFFGQYGFLPAVKTISGALERDRELVIQRFDLNHPSLWPLVDRCARIPHALFKAPIRITLLNGDSQLVLAAIGCPLQRRQTLLYNESLCSHTVLRKDGCMLEIPDTRNDWRFRKTPGFGLHRPSVRFADLCAGASRFYVGQPILLPVEDGGPLIPVGSFCLLGDRPRSLNAEERALLVDLAHLLSTDIQRVFREARQRKEALRRTFLSDLIVNLSSFDSAISPPIDPSEIPHPHKPPNPQSILSVTSDVRRLLDSDFACLLDLHSLHLLWRTEEPRQSMIRAVSRSKHGWIGHDQRRVSSDSIQESQRPELHIIDHSCSNECKDYSPESVFNAPRAVSTLINFLRSYNASSSSGYVHSGSDSMLQRLLPPDSQAHIVVPLFSNALPTLVFIVSTSKPWHKYEPSDVSFASSFATLCLGTLDKMKLTKADASKTAFVSMISHELRTPLHGLLSQLELIREFSTKEFIAETEWFLQAAEVCGLTLRDVVSAIPNTSPWEKSMIMFQENGSAEDVQAYYTESDLNVLAIEVMSVAYGRRRQWESVTGQSESAVEMSAVCVGQYPVSFFVLLNLASNALKYTPKGTIVLSLRELTTTPMDKALHDQRLIEFTMRDTGIGMSNEYRERIFTPFSQENTFNPGAGLGMSISEAILHRLGGEMIITSELGKGTTVTFTLPIDFLEPRPVRKESDGPRIVTKTLISLDDISLLERSTPSPRTTPSSPRSESHPYRPAPLNIQDSNLRLKESTPDITQPDAGALRVLVVEDNHIGRKILTTLLTRKGVLFREAADGLSALDVYRDFLPHLVWTDVSMPVMDGIESARRMRTIETQLQIPPAHIIALTGHSSRGDMEAALLGEASLDEWLIKGQANLKTLVSGFEKVQRKLRRGHADTSRPTVVVPS
ncbi:hypothetical protein R3P38DRAFT_3316186 [Favolaschia claudopus]|uniref:histidine kinase n=1 Tax=Favolaschia claudopus TaxID=2862362 RepID=A0AAW0BLA4_9AGAR